MAPKVFEPQKILVPIDFSQTSMLAIEHGAFMAKLYRADLYLVHVLERSWESFSIVAPEIKVEVPSNLEGLIEQKLNNIANKIRTDYGVSSTIISTTGHICTELVELAKNEKCDLIVMGTHGASGLQEFFIGSNAYKVVTKSTIPVLTVQSHIKRIGFSEILLPIDNTDHSRQKVNHTVAIAKKYGSRVHVYGVLDEDDAENLNKFQQKVETVIDYLKKCDIPYTTKIDVVHNQVKATLSYAKQISCDLIVIMTDQEENFVGSFLGAYAQQIVNHSWAPVLSIKPIEHPENIPWLHPY